MGFKLERDFYKIEEFEKLSIEAGYGGINFTLTALQKYAKESKKILVSGVQTHSSNIEVIKKGENLDLDAVPFKDTDGLITDREDLLLYTKHADCQGIYFYDIEKKVIGLCHSGWKGSFHEIGIEMLKLFQNRFKSSLEDIVVGIGIGISDSKYEVSKDFKESFTLKFGSDIVERAFIKKDGKIYFDNGVFIKESLKKYGVRDENIILSDECTYSNRELHSYRRDKENSGRNFAFIHMLQNNNKG